MFRNQKTTNSEKQTAPEAITTDEQQIDPSCVQRCQLNVAPALDMEELRNRGFGFGC